MARSAAVRPQLFSVVSIGFPAYFTFLVSGFLFAVILAALTARRWGENPDVIIDLGLAMLLAGVVGSRILHVIADGYFWDYVHLCTNPSAVAWQVTQAECASPSYGGVWDAAANVCRPSGPDCWAWARFWAGGLTYYGGFLGAIPTAWYILRRDRFSFWKAADLAGFTISFGLIFGRMGCLLAGCCFGVETHGPAGLIFPPRSLASEWQFKHGMLDATSRFSLPVHPTQIYESAASLAITAVCLLWVAPRKKYDGHVFVAFVVLYAVARFVLEFWRSDERGGLLGLSTSQLIGVVLVAAAVLLHKLRAAGRLAPRLAAA